MTLEEISGVYYTNKEIEGIQREMETLHNKNFFKAVEMSGMPKGNSGKDMFTDYTEKSITLEEMMQYNLKKLQEERKKVEAFIETIEDRELRVIIRLRTINNMKWEEIGESLGMDRRTAARKFYHFFDKK